MVFDRTYAGLRCRVTRPLTTRQGFLPRDSRGTVVSQMENLGRQLTTVAWDNGLVIPMLEGEVEIAGQKGYGHDDK